MSFLRIIGPASIEVWISSPVRSRKPVLMKQMRLEAFWIQALRLTVVRRSSSMMPTFMVLAGNDGVENTFRNFRAASVEHGVGEHVMADIAHQQKAAAVQLEFLAVRRLVDTVGV